jgi:hypothetical protein
MADDEAFKVAYYNSARTEMIERIKLRDLCLIAYIASAGAYFQFFIKGDIVLTTATTFPALLMEAGVVLVFPVISVVFTLLTLQHHVMIGKLGEFIRREYQNGAKHWDRDYASWVDKSYLSARTFGQGILLLIPMGYTATFAINALPRSNGELRSTLVVGVVLLIDIGILVWIIWLHIWAYKVRVNTDSLPTANLEVLACGTRDPSDVLHSEHA